MRTEKVTVKELAEPSGEYREVAVLTDEELLLEYRQTGDRSCFSELVQRYERELFNYLRRYLRDSQAAEDVFQATFLLIHLKCQQFEEGRRFRPWLYAVATNAAIDAQRRDRRHRAVSLDRVGSKPSQEKSRPTDMLVSEDLDPPAMVSRNENRALMQAAMQSLNDQMRTVVHLVYYQGLKYREAADILNVPVGTVKSRLHTAIQKLHEYWNRPNSGTSST